MSGNDIADQLYQVMRNGPTGAMRTLLTAISYYVTGTGPVGKTGPR